MESPIVFTSNRIQTLIEILREQIFSNTTPFADQRVFLPDSSLKNPLMIKLLTKEIDVISGIQFEGLGSGIQSLFYLFTGKSLFFPPLDLLSLHLESLIAQERSDLESYFATASSELEVYSKAQSLARVLAKEFLRYGTFGGPELKKWIKKPGWQQKLWSQVYSYWNYPYQLLDCSFESPATAVEVHIFNFPFIPRLYHQFFEKIAPHASIFYYQFSPCQEFWTDIASNRERLLMQKKQGAQPELNAYLKSHNPLLANFSKLTRATFRFFEETDIPLTDHYTAPPSTLLGKIQTDILHDAHPLLQSLGVDSSLSLHPAISKLREIEILYANLTQLSYLPSDIQIFAPDIASYAPYIELIFGSEESPFDFQIRDLPRTGKSNFLEIFLDLLSLPEKRFDLQSVFKVLSHPFVRRCFHLHEKDVTTFRSWVDKLGVKWGINSDHRHQLLSIPMLETGSSGTWEHAFSHLLKSLVFLSAQPTTWDVPSPTFSEAENLGLCISIIRSLKSDLDRLETPMTLTSWALFLRTIVDTYFSFPKEELSHLQFFYEKLTLLKNLDSQVSAPFPYSSIKRFLQSTFREKSGVLAAKQLECLTFSSLKPGNVFPSKVIYLLGMQEGNFPRPYTRTSLSEFEGDYCPTPSDEDRALFLELVLTPSKRLYISYLQVNEKDSKEELPSLLIQELFSYIETHYSLKQKVLTYTHPPFPFHHESHSLNFSKRHYQAALSFYNNNASVPLIPEYLVSHPLPQSSDENLFISLKHLCACAKHPIRFYFNHVLGIYLRYESQDEEFSLSALSNAILQTASLNSPLSKTLREASDHGKLPLGRFKEVAALKLQEEIYKTHQNLKVFDIKEVQPLPVSLTLSLPHNKQAFIEGSLNNTTPQGLIFSGDPKDLLKIWPEFLVFSCMKEVDAEKKLLFAQTGKTLTLLDPEKALVNFLSYYTKSLQTPSPLLPRWTGIFLKKTPKDLEKAIAQKVTQGNDPYVNWGFSQYNASVIFETWSPYLRETFSTMVEACGSLIV